MQPRKLPRAAALLLLTQVRTAAGIVRVAVYPARHLQEAGTRGIVAVAPFFGIIGGHEGAGETPIDGRAHQPPDASCDCTDSGALKRARPEVVMRHPAVRGLREGGGEGLQGPLVQCSRLLHKGLQVTGGDALLGQGKFCSAHRRSSSKTG